jgi:PAS domain S-box-containing protein
LLLERLRRAARAGTDALVRTRELELELALRRAEQSRDRNRERLFRITDNATVLLAQLDAEDRYTFVNAPYARRFGLTPRDFVGRKIPDLLGAAAFAQLEPYIARVMAGERVEFEAELDYRDLGKQFMRCAYQPERDPDGRVTGYVASLLNITQRKRAEEALRESAQRLAEADRRKDEFLATLAHELRNPLAPIRNALHFLQLRDTGDADVRNARDIIDRQVRHMVRLVDDLLDVSRVTLGQIRLQNETVSLSLVIANAIEASRPLIEAARHHLTVQLPNEPLYLRGDGVRLSQVFQNLLNNAAKYTPPGGRIELRAEHHPNLARISVHDNGVGIRRDMLARIFEMFAQVERTHALAQGGLGIGLALAQQLVQMHGGDITVDSPGEGSGSEFTVVLPLTAPPALRPPLGSPGVDSPGGPRRRVLVVDDNIDAAESLATNLQCQGHDTRAVFDGESALLLAREFLPEVVLLDIGLPGQDGYAVCRQLRAQPRGQDVAIIALTGWGQEEDRRRTSEAGFDHHLVKPVDPTLLARLIVTAGHTPSTTA